jgi:Arginine deiminase
MATRARWREALHLNLMYRSHPMFAAAEPWFWSDCLDHGPALEGGDVLLLGNGCVLVGVGERSQAAAVESYAERLFAAGVADRVIAVTLPLSRSTIHLDTVMTMVDRDAFTICAALLDRLDGYTLTATTTGVRARHEPDLFRAIARALGVPAVQLIHADADLRTAQREQSLIAADRRPAWCNLRSLLSGRGERTDTESVRNVQGRLGPQMGRGSLARPAARAPFAGGRPRSGRGVARPGGGLDRVGPDLGAERIRAERVRTDAGRVRTDPDDIRARRVRTDADRIGADRERPRRQASATTVEAAAPNSDHPDAHRGRGIAAAH